MIKIIDFRIYEIVKISKHQYICTSIWMIQGSMCTSNLRYFGVSRAKRPIVIILQLLSCCQCEKKILILMYPGFDCSYKNNITNLINPEINMIPKKISFKKILILTVSDFVYVQENWFLKMNFAKFIFPDFDSPPALKIGRLGKCSSYCEYYIILVITTNDRLFTKHNI